MRKDRQYYSRRRGLHKVTHIDLPCLRDLFVTILRDFRQRHYFQEALGYYCVDAGDVPGTIGADEEGFFLRKLRKPGLWPIDDNATQYSEDDLFDVIELLHDLVSKPLEGRYHSYGECGWHYETFDRHSGQQEYRTEINGLLCDYGCGYELSPDGEIQEIPEVGLGTLLEGTLYELDPTNVEKRVREAIQRFRRRGSSLDDRRVSVRALADVLEFLRPQLGKVITRKDDGTLFRIANEFGIRHHDVKQKTDYDEAVWFSWMFYFYLATIHAVTRLIMSGQEKGSPHP